MNSQILIQKIKALKEEKKAVILAHNYQLPEIQDIADFLGDSLELSRISRDVDARVIVFCGVRFMAETAKILSPHKKVLLPSQGAGCPLADTMTRDDLLDLKKKHPQAKVISYVNSSAEIKAESDACCTSANAVTVVRNIDSQKIIFVPDGCLGRWVKKNNPSKEIILWPGSCYVHQEFGLEDIARLRDRYPEAEVLAHPECRPEIQDRADFVLSTSGMLKRPGESKAEQFIIATEEGMLYRLKKENPGKEFYSLGKDRVCSDMKKTGLPELYRSLEEEDYEIRLKEDIIRKAGKALEEMVKYT